MQSPNNHIHLDAICARMIDLVENEFEYSLKELAQKLGYENQSPLTRVKNGIGFIGIEKLGVFAQLKTSQGQYPNINWVLTGDGEKLKGSNTEKEKAYKILKLLGRDRVSGLLKILTDACQDT